MGSSRQGWRVKGGGGGGVRKQVHSMCVAMADLTWAHWLLNVQQVCNLTQLQSPISLTQGRVKLIKPAITNSTLNKNERERDMTER